MHISWISCPNCNTPIPSNVRYCEFCGVDLGFAAVAAEQRMKTPAKTAPLLPITPEVLVPRLGQYLRERGVLSDAALQRGLAYQKDALEHGRSLLLGQALIELGLLEREVLDQAITEQILLLQSALQHSNDTLEQRVKERTEELEQAMRRLSELNQLKSNFISNISHELRTPLTHIKGYLELLHEGELGELNEMQFKAIDVASRSAKKLEKLIDDLLQFSLAVRGELTLRVDLIDLSRVLRNAVDLSSQSANGKHVTLHMKMPDDAVYIRGDAEKLQWVMGHLLENAIKFNRQGGQVWLQLILEDHLAVVCVEDTGIGMQASQQAELFREFHQLDSSTTRKFGGTGMGLALVRRILQAHGTDIRVKSTPEVGSVFCFSLPIVEKKENSQ